MAYMLLAKLMSVQPCIVLSEPMLEVFLQYSGYTNVQLIHSLCRHSYIKARPGPAAHNVCE